MSDIYYVQNYVYRSRSLIGHPEEKDEEHNICIVMTLHFDVQRERHRNQITKKTKKGEFCGKEHTHDGVVTRRVYTHVRTSGEKYAKTVQSRHRITRCKDATRRCLVLTSSTLANKLTRPICIDQSAHTTLVGRKSVTTDRCLLPEIHVSRLFRGVERAKRRERCG